MKYISLIITIIVLFSACKTRTETTDKPDPTTESNDGKTTEMPTNTYSDAEVVKANNSFAFELYGEIGSEKNQIFSPFSISSALAMTYAGARKTTAEEFVKVFHFTSDQDAFHPAYKKLIADIESAQNEDLQISVANALWPQKKYVFLKEYLDLMKEYYGVEITYLDYKKDAEGSRLIINKWVEDKTNDKIKDLLKPGILTELTRMVLTNAIYFKGDWKNAFNEDATYEAPFFLDKNEQVLAERMNITQGSVKYMENEDLSMLELPYSKDKMSMVFILPKEKDGIEGLEKNLNYMNYNRWYMQMNPQKVIIGIPKFKIDFYIDLSEVLKAMGLETAFTGNANFSGMTGIEDLKIDKVIHKAFIEVNEAGTEAAAATAVIMIEKTSAISPPPPKAFIADHPFIYIIKDNKTGAILFMGKVMNPKE
jgi:serine protease inhibitor